MKTTTETARKHTAAAILSMLYAERGRWVSGEAIAGALGCSRMTVANYIRGLRAEGFEIRSHPRRGHLMSRLADVLGEASLALFCEEKIYFYDCLDSTFAKGRELGGGLIVAARQTAGYGRRRRAFCCAEGGAYFGWKFVPELSPRRANLITLGAGVAVCRAVGAYGIEARVKYPNDCLIGDRKFAGIMTECVTTGDTIGYANVGVGINVHNRPGPGLEAIATNLDEHGGRDIVRAELIGGVVRELRGLLRDPDAIVGEIERLSYYRPGDELLLIGDEGDETGVYAGVDREGYLLAKTRGGERRVTIGEVSLRRKESK